MTTIPDELVVAGIERAFSAWLQKPEVEARMIDRLAEIRAEEMTTAQAAEMLEVHPKTLLKKHVEWGITKSVALGADEPRFFRSQISARLKAKAIKGRELENVTEFPTTRRAG
jgi:hypothetical protein